MTPEFNTTASDVIKQRYSCRHYHKTPIAADDVKRIAAFAQSIQSGPMGAPLRFEIVAASEDDNKALRGYGTYGFIKHAAGFIIGAAGQGRLNLEDFGYGMESVVLRATAMGLGTCWLGGTFTRSSFSRAISLASDEILPAVTAVGHAAEGNRSSDRLRRVAKSDSRLPWSELFYERGSIHLLTEDNAGAYRLPLDMLRLAPSASNRQPWRVVKDGAAFDFYLKRSQGYGPGGFAASLMGLSDLQRVDMGIAMCHFELAAREQGLGGAWLVRETEPPPPGNGMEYVVTWVG